MKVLLLLFLSIVSVAFACDCITPTNQGAFCGADFVSHIKIVSSNILKTDPETLHYAVKHVDTYKAPYTSPLSADIYTSFSSASCGVEGLVVGQEYLVAGYLDDKKKLRIHSCGQFQGGPAWNTVSPALKKQLKAGFKCPATTNSP